MRTSSTTITTIFISLLMCCAAQAATAAELEQAQTTLKLPIRTDLSAGNQIFLLVNIPDRFRSLSKDPARVPQFIPADENQANCSEHITGQTFLGSTFDADDLMGKFQTALKSYATSKILKESDERFGGFYTRYRVSSCIITYKTYKNPEQEEAILLKYYSGPADCSTFQYAIAVKPNMTEDSIIKKLEDFERNHTQIVENF